MLSRKRVSRIGLVVAFLAVATWMSSALAAQSLARVSGGGTGDIVIPDWGSETQFGLGGTVRARSADSTECIDKFVALIDDTPIGVYEQIYPGLELMTKDEMKDLVDSFRGNDWHDASGHFMCKLVADAPRDVRPSEKYFVVINMDLDYGRVEDDGSVLFCGEHLAIDAFSPRVQQLEGVSLLRVWKENGKKKFWYVDNINVAYGGDTEVVVSGNLLIKRGKGKP